MNSMMASTKLSSESSSYNESPLLARSRASSNASLSTSPNSFFLQQQHHNARLMLFSQLQEEELEAPINIYHEHRDHLEEDKKARTELDTEILNDDLYCPVQQQDVNNNNNGNGKTSRGLNIGNFASFLPRFLPNAFSTNNNYGGVMESTKTDTWDYCHNDMFNTTLGSFDGINSVVCQ